MKGFIRFLTILMLVVACDGTEVPPAANTSDYFPLGKGIYQIYQVQTKKYYASAIVEDASYQLKTEVADSFHTANGKLTYVIHRSTRPTSNDEWQPLDTWSVRSDRSELVVAEGNTSYVKIRLPYVKSNTWDGNAYNALGKDDYVFREVGLPAEIEGMRFEKTIVVEQEHNDDPIVFRDEREETYAADAGLISRKMIQLRYCTDDVCLGQQKVDEGIEMTMVITQYGKK